jgi:diguanylate cyclase (GGDEF)-like protein
MAVLRTRFEAGLDAGLAEMRRLAALLPSDAAAVSLREAAHSLAGRAASFGHPRLETTARALERLLAGPPMRRADQEALARLIAGLVPDGTEPQGAAAAGGAATLSMAAEPPAMDDLPPRRPRGRTVLLIGREPGAADPTLDYLAYHGYRTFAAADRQELDYLLATDPPDLAVVDLDANGGPEHGLKLLEQVQATQGCPSVVLSGCSNGAARLAALRAGADAYLLKPVRPADLLDEVDRHLDPPPEEPARVLVVEDQAALARTYTAILGSHGLATEIAVAPDAILEAIQRHTPDLVLMDLYLHEANGIELVRMVRQLPGCANLPVLFLSGETRLEVRFEAIERGGDDFLVKPVSPTQLIGAVLSRVRRYRALVRALDTDPLTRLLNRASFSRRAERVLARLAGAGKPFALAMLDVDHFKRVNDTYGHPAGDQVLKSLALLLRRRLRACDLIGRFGGEEFVAALPETTAEEGRRVLNEIRVSFARIVHDGLPPFTATFSCGIAGLRPGLGLQELVAAADAVLYAAKRAGRDRVLLTSGQNG